MSRNHGRIVDTVLMKLGSSSPINTTFGHLHRGIEEAFSKIRHELDSAPDPQGVVIKTFRADHAVFKSGLYGPAAGDPPVEESIQGHKIDYRSRPVGEGQNPRGVSRLINKPLRDTDLFTVIYGPHKDEKTGTLYPKVLYTAFGGPPAEKEPTDPYLKEHPEDKAGYNKAVAFWKDHALSHESF